FVTHDQDEALAMASRVAVMNKGKLEQVGTPADLYERPNSRFVADFIGSVNLFPGTVGPSGAVASPDVETPFQIAAPISSSQGASVWVALRPEKIAMEKDAGENLPAHNAARGSIRQISYLGSESIYEVELERGRAVK